ncbi:uncharacterized protein LOC115630133 [Scaptodrosophila lebanonensis]|uniref:Uncharacterized protein LOC115630133 n=1 Tax=Drosophila lebanonensis TaxID=7225 RepID=A0A6J2U2K1_DROLE|nr:uncharacterized protein LOC115630133 [Scaptodrosophila lebanonensis]
MSGKLIMKRKRADQQQTKRPDEEQENENTAEKRHRMDLELKPEPVESDDAPNSILFEALNKIIELQAELDAFEQDLDERDGFADDAEEDAHLDAEVAANFATAPQRSDAEALGFAMCARETLLFLQSEGVDTESVLYKTLLGKLMGGSNGLLQA